MVNSTFPFYSCIFSVQSPGGKRNNHSSISQSASFEKGTREHVWERRDYHTSVSRSRSREEYYILEPGEWMEHEICRNDITTTSSDYSCAKDLAKCCCKECCIKVRISLTRTACNCLDLLWLAFTLIDTKFVYLSMLIFHRFANQRNSPQDKASVTFNWMDL